MTDRASLLVASLLERKLPKEILASATPVSQLDSATAEALEPWLTMEQEGRTVELHIREGGDVELHVFVPGRNGDPRESLFVCDDKDYAAFVDYLVTNFDTLVKRLS